MLGITLIFLVTLVTTWPGTLEAIERLNPHPPRGIRLHALRTLRRMVDDATRRYPNPPRPLP